MFLLLLSKIIRLFTFDEESTSLEEANIKQKYEMKLYFYRIMSIENLESIKLTNNRPLVPFLNAIKESKNLIRLDLSHTMALGDELFEILPTLSYLEDLNLSWCNIEGMQLIKCVIYVA